MPTPSFQPITPHIYKLDLPFLNGRLPVGVWLIRSDRGWLMVDAGPPGFEQTVVEQVLQATGGQRPYLLVLTHGHLDHGAAAETIREAWRIPIAAGRLEIPYLLGPDRYARLPARFPLYHLVQHFGAPVLIGRNVHYPLDDGQQLDGLRVIHVAGHAPGMIALLHTADRALLCADVFYHLRGKLTDPSPLFTYDPKRNREAQAQLADLDFDHLLPSHGPAILNTGRAQARALVASRVKKGKHAAARAPHQPAEQR